MRRVTAAGPAQRFGLCRDLARQASVAITHRGRETLVLLSSEGCRRRRALDDRRSRAAGAIPDDLLAELERETPPYRTDPDPLLRS